MTRLTKKSVREVLNEVLQTLSKEPSTDISELGKVKLTNSVCIEYPEERQLFLLTIKEIPYQEEEETKGGILTAEIEP